MGQGAPLVLKRFSEEDSGARGNQASASTKERRGGASPELERRWPDSSTVSQKPWRTATCSRRQMRSRAQMTYFGTVITLIDVARLFNADYENLFILSFSL